MNKTTLISVLVFFAFALVILSIVPPPETASAPAADTVLLGIFAGITPCADCSGIRTRLTLVQDGPYVAEGSYELSLTYIDRDVEPYIQTGLWTTERGTPTDPDATVYALDPDMPEHTQRYLRVTDDTIRLLDQDGNEIDASLPFDLVRVETE